MLETYFLPDSELKQIVLMFDEIINVTNNATTNNNYLKQRDILSFINDSMNSITIKTDYELTRGNIIKISDIGNKIAFFSALYKMLGLSTLKVAGFADLWATYYSEFINLVSIDKHYFTPILSGACFKPLFKSLLQRTAQENNLELPNFFAETQSDITRVVLSKLPVPVEDTPWEDVLGFKDDSKTQDQIHRIKRWMRKANANPFNERLLSDEIDELLYEYEVHIKHYLKKYSHAKQEAAFITPLEILEDLAKLKLSNTIKKAFALRNQKVDLDFAERTYPGNEVAYIYSAQKQFGTD